MDNGNRWNNCIPTPWPPKGPGWPFPGIPPNGPHWPNPGGPTCPRPDPPEYYPW